MGVGGERRGRLRVPQRTLHRRPRRSPRRSARRRRSAAGRAAGRPRRPARAAWCATGDRRCSGAAARPRPRRTASRRRGPARRARRASEQRVGDVDGALRVVLRQPDLDPPSRRWTCRRTCTWRRRKSTSPTWSAAVSPSRRPAKAQSPTKARNRGSAASRISRTTSGVGIAMAASRLRSRGSRTWTVGSTAIMPSRTAARNTERTLTNRVLIVPGASGRGRLAVATVIDFTHASTWLGRIRRRSTSVKVVDRAASDIAFRVPSVQSWSRPQASK